MWIETLNFCVEINLRSEMSTEKQAVTVRDLAEEAKKRIVFLIMCVFGLAFLMSCKALGYFILLNFCKHQSVHLVPLFIYFF